MDKIQGIMDQRYLDRKVGRIFIWGRGREKILPKLEQKMAEQEMIRYANSIVTLWEDEEIGEGEQDRGSTKDWQTKVTVSKTWSGWSEPRIYTMEVWASWTVVRVSRRFNEVVRQSGENAPTDALILSITARSRDGIWYRLSGNDRLGKVMLGETFEGASRPERGDTRSENQFHLCQVISECIRFVFHARGGVQMSVFVSAQSTGHELVRMLQIQLRDRGIQRDVGKIKLWGLGPQGVDLNLDHPIGAQELMDYGESKVELWEVPEDEVIPMQSQKLFEDNDFKVIRNLETGRICTIRKTEREAEKPINQTKVCCICQTRAANYMVHPCGHKCGCKECLDKCPKCPICRQFKLCVFMVYESGIEAGEDMKEEDTSPPEDPPILTGMEKEFQEAFGGTRISYPPRYQLAVISRYHDLMHRRERQASQAGLSPWTIGGTDGMPIAEWEKDLLQEDMDRILFLGR